MGQRTAGRKRASGYTLYGAAKDQTAVSWLGTSADGTLLYALNNSDQQLYILETHGGRAVARLRSATIRLSARLSKDGKTLYVANLGIRERRDRGRQRRRAARTIAARSRPIRIRTTSR